MSSSEAVMVSPEQCATAPKVTTKMLNAPPPPATSSVRLVLLAVLALAAATGAMFGVVVFGNEFTKDVHPGSGHSNTVALVDSEDRAIATADVESYVSLLDLPLLGTAELNKVDGITFSTYKGIEHRKITGYTISKETATVGDSVSETPYLSLSTSAPGSSAVTIEISVRDAKAWMQEVDESLVSSTPIDTSSNRRLADGSGSCLANGACLYSRDELLTVNAQNRALSEGSFFARADVAAYQVDLSGENVMDYIQEGNQFSYLSGEYLDDGHVIQMKVAQSSVYTAVYYYNVSSKNSKVWTRNGTFAFTGDVMTECVTSNGKTDAILSHLRIESLDIDFMSATVTHGAEEPDFLPHNALGLTEQFCFVRNQALGNLTSPESMMHYKGAFYGGNSARKLAASIPEPTLAEKRKEIHEEVKALMNDPNSDFNFRNHMEENRELALSWGFNQGTYAPGTYITHFMLWIATRLADPTFVSNANLDANTDTVMTDAFASSSLPASFIKDLAGKNGVTFGFQNWTGFSSYGHAHAPPELWENVGDFDDTSKMGDSDFLDDSSIAISKAFWHALFPGSCSGGYGLGGGAEVDWQVLTTACQAQAAEKAEDSSYCWGCYSRRHLMAEEADAKRVDARQTMSEEDAALDAKRMSRFSRKERRRQLVTSDEYDYVADLLGGYCESLIDGDELGGDFDVLQGNSWASLLTIKNNEKIESVASFQGTKANDKSMLRYNLDQDPVYVWIGTRPSIIMEGHYNYMESLLVCMFDQIAEYWDEEGMEPTFVTGHSLGGAAATLFMRSDDCWMDPTDSNCYQFGTDGDSNAYNTYPRLVTFGAPPTSYRGLYSRYGIKCTGEKIGEDDSYTYESNDCEASTETGDTDTYLTSGGYDNFNEWGRSNTCSDAMTQSVRFWHKFDPVPSLGMWKGQYNHNMETSIMIFDMHEASCSESLSCDLFAKSSTDKSDYNLKFDGFTGYVDPFAIKYYLCDAFGVQPVTKVFSCWQDVTSYVSLLNPYPCGQMVFQRMYQEIADAWLDWNYGTMNFLDLRDTLFNEFEELSLCNDAWKATLDSYFQVAALDLPKYAGLFFTFTWVHSTYGFYPLCINVANDGSITDFGGGDYDNKLDVTSSSCESNAGSCANSCKQWSESSSYGEDTCIKECMAAACI